MFGVEHAAFQTTSATVPVSYLYFPTPISVPTQSLPPAAPPRYPGRTVPGPAAASVARCGSGGFADGPEPYGVLSVAGGGQVRRPHCGFGERHTHPEGRTARNGA